MRLPVLACIFAAAAAVAAQINSDLRRWRTTSTAENVTAALLAQHPRDDAQVDTLVREHYLKNANYHIHTDPWYTTRWLLDVSGSASIWIGALLYNVSCFEGAYKVRVIGELR